MTEATMTEVNDDLAAFEASFNGTEPAPAPEPVVEAPVEPELEAEQEPEAAGAEAEPEGDAPEPKKDDKSANRFTKQTKELRETQRKLRELEEKLANLNPSAPVLTPDSQSDNNSTVEAPDPAKYQYGELDPQFIRDTARHEAKLLIEAAAAEQVKQQDTQRREADAQREVAALQEKAVKIEQAGSGKYSDFKEVVIDAAQAGDWSLTKEMFELVAEADAPADILYHLASNPDEAERVAGLPARQQALWFGRMDARFAAPPEKPARKATQAPAPITSTRGGSARPAVNLTNLDDPAALAAMEKALFG